MADQIGTLFAQVVADQAGFRSDMAAMAQTVQSTTVKMNANLAKISKASDVLSGSFRLVASAAAAFGLTLGVRGLVNFARSAIETADAIGEAASAAGVGAERFQRLQFVFGQNGVSASEFEGAMRKLNQGLGAFINTGAGPAASAIEQLGLKQDIASGKIRTAESFFDSIVGRLGQYDNAAQAAALSAALFGREAGSKLAPVLREGAEAMREAEAAAKGIFTDEQIARANEINDKFNELSNTIGVKFKGAVLDSLAGWQALLSPTTAQRMGELNADIVRTNELISRLTKKDVGSLGVQKEVEAATNALRAYHAELDKLWEVRKRELGGGQTIPGLETGLPDDGLSEVTVGAKRIEAMRSMDAMLQEEFRKSQEQKTAIMQEALDRELQSATDSVEAQLQIRKYQADQEVMLRRSVADSAIGLLSAVGSEHRGAAIAALALQKVLTLKQIFFSGQAEARAASAWATVLGGPAAGAAAFAKVMLATKFQMGLVAATGLVEAAQLSSGGTQSTLGTTANPINTRSASSSAGSIAPLSHSQKVLEVHLHGWSPKIVRELMAEMKREIDDYDVVLFNADSTQARLIAP